MKSQCIIAIDGPAGAGKSTIASVLARRLNGCYLDTGAMYRAITVAAMRQQIDLDDYSKLAEIARQSRIEISWKDRKMLLTLNGEDISEAIRQREITANSHKIANSPEVRKLLVKQQRRIAGQVDTLITEGRDQGTIVFPNATIKFYLDADIKERAQRRHRELQAKGTKVSLEEIQANITQRDQRDTQRAIAPLKPADDAIHVDTTGQTIDQVIDKLCALIKENAPQ